MFIQLKLINIGLPAMTSLYMYVMHVEKLFKISFFFLVWANISYFEDYYGFNLFVVLHNVLNVRATFWTLFLKRVLIGLMVTDTKSWVKPGKIGSRFASIGPNWVQYGHPVCGWTYRDQSMQPQLNESIKID